MIQSFSIPGPLPGANEVMGKGSRWGYRALKATWTRTILACIAQAKLKPMRRVCIEYHWHEPNKRRDLDNITFAVKFVNDALVAAGVLKDDGWDEIGMISHTFAVDKTEPRLIVCLLGE
jgi:Holliday junction resolvase RusA-like endonuclease